MRQSHQRAPIQFDQCVNAILNALIGATVGNNLFEKMHLTVYKDVSP